MVQAHPYPEGDVGKPAQGVEGHLLGPQLEPFLGPDFCQLTSKRELCHMKHLAISQD